MEPLRARVQDGHLVLNEPTCLPEGAELDLVADDGGDALSDSDRDRLHAALTASWESAQAGRICSGSALIEELRRQQ